jgi:hypothetical protein
MILPQAEEHLRDLQTFFQDFGTVSGLHLNIGKTVLVPLWEFDEHSVRNTVAQQAPDWGGICIQGHAKYLGFYVDPLRHNTLGTLPFRSSRKGLSSGGEWALGCC